MTKDDETWVAGVTSRPENPSLDIRREAGDVSSTRASAEISVSREVSLGVDEFIRDRGETYRERIQARPPGGPGQTTLSDGTQANEWARQIVDEMATVRTLPNIHGIDLFMACPLELAVLVGWWLNAAGSIHIYHWLGNAGPYVSAWTLISS